MDPDYKGENIEIYEWPNACEIFMPTSKESVNVCSEADAKALIESLTRFVESFKRNRKEAPKPGRLW